MSFHVRLSVMSNSLQPLGLHSLWNSPGQNTGVGSLSLFQGIFPIQGSKASLPHCRRILYQLSHKGSPRILEWEDYPFSRGSSRPRNQTRVSCIAGGFFTNWAIREALVSKWKSLSHIWLLATPWTIQFMEFSSPEYWSGEPFPSPRDLPNPGIEVGSPALQADSLPVEPQWKPSIPNWNNRILTLKFGGCFQKVFRE